MIPGLTWDHYMPSQICGQFRKAGYDLCWECLPFIPIYQLMIRSFEQVVILLSLSCFCLEIIKCIA